MRRTSLPFSIVQTKVCPASVRIAIAGKRRHRRPGRQRDAAGPEHAAAQRRVGVRDMDEHQDRARAGFRRRIDALDRAGEAAIAEAVDRERRPSCRR